jgi:pimeloyl-ACP methyl ester carboxylesterase
MNVIDEGSGPAVVLIHGLPGSAYDWRPLPERLAAAGFRVVRYDRIGYGYSDRRRSDEDHRLEVNASELLDLLSTLKVESPVLVGWSYGGGVALRAAEEAPKRVRAVLLLGSLGPARPANPSADRVLIATEPIQRWGIASGFLARPGMRQMGRLAFSGEAPDWWPGHTLSMLALPGAVHTWVMETKYLDVTVLHPEAVTAPVFVLHGSEDRMVPPAVGADLQRRLPRSVLTEVAGGSHMLPNTHPDLVREKLEELIRWADSRFAR